MKQQTLFAPSLTEKTADTKPIPGPFPYRDWMAARGQLESTLHKGPFYGQVLGASGTGKTCLARDLSASLDRHQHQILYLSSPPLSLYCITRFLAAALHITPKYSALETIQRIAEVLRFQPTHLLVWFDEASLIPVQTLLELRSIIEFSHEVAQLFSVILSGPPELKTLLDTPALFALRRRMSLRCTLKGLRREELDAFLLHRFGSVDAKRLPQGLCDELFERTRGIPALLDRVVGNALCRAEQGLVSVDHLREALDATAF